MPSHSTVPMGPHPLSTAGRPQEGVAWHRAHALHGVNQPRSQFTMPHGCPQVLWAPSIAVPAWYTKLHPQAVRPNSTDSVVRNQVGYARAQERTSWRDSRAPQGASHCRAVRTWDRPRWYHTRAGKYLDQCLCSTTADPEAQQMAAAMQYLAQLWFLHQRVVLGASLLDSYRDALDSLVRQKPH